MNERRKKAVKQIIFGAVLLIVAVLLYWYGNRAPVAASFNECAEAGYPVMESYPRQCKTPDGTTFREDIGNELEKDNLIRIATPRPNTLIASSFTIKGVARGNWFFEGSFPIRLFDGNGEQIARGVAQAQKDPIRADGASPASNGVGWMTEDFVPFEATLQFALPTTAQGTLLLDKDNPSGLPENTDALRVPVRFW